MNIYLLRFSTWTLCFLALPLLAARPSGGGKVVVGVVEVSEVEDHDIRHYTGQVISRSVVNIVPRVSGEILEIGFQDGGVVQKGQMLYKLDPVQYEAAVKGAEASIEKCKAELTYAQSNYDRLNLLYQKQATSLDLLENARATLGAAQAALLSAEADLITARDNLKNTVITAPHGGIVGVTNFTSGNYITPNSGTLLTIIQTQPMRVRFSISVADLLNMFGSTRELLENGCAEVKLADGSSYGETGVIELLNNEVNARTDAIQIYASFPNAERKLIMGNTLTVKLSHRKGKLLPAVTPSALMHDSNGSFVYIIGSGNKVEKRYVTPGNATSDRQLIQKGLTRGEIVITKGTHKVLPGMTIAPDSQQKG